MKIQVFGGSGFVGSEIARQIENCIVTPRHDYTVEGCDIIYLISTVSNYNVKTDPLIDIDTKVQVPAAVKKFREDLRKLRIETSNEDIWSEKDDPCAEEAAVVVSHITKKTYKPKEKESFKELQKDVKKVSKNQPKLKELLLTPIKKVKI
jgi:hypothetical protein